MRAALLLHTEHIRSNSSRVMIVLSRLLSRTISNVLCLVSLETVAELLSLFSAVITQFSTESRPATPSHHQSEALELTTIIRLMFPDPGDTEEGGGAAPASGKVATMVTVRGDKGAMFV